MRVVLIRHGMTEGNRKRRYIGRTDEPLMDTKALDLDYPDCSLVVVSPARRCAETAAHIYPDKKAHVCEKLRECDFGDFENKSYEDLKDNPDYIKWLESGGKIAFPNGEEHGDFVKRCIEGFFETLGLGGEDIAFVIHGGSIMAVMQHIFGGDFYDYQIRNGGMFILEYDGRIFSLEDRNV